VPRSLAPTSTALVALAIATTALVPVGLAGTLGGVRGTVTRGPIAPVCREGVPCTAPASGVTLVFVRAGVRVAAVTTSGQGTYRVVLPAGRYVVRRLRAPLVGGMVPSIVTVRIGRLSVVNFSIDTGIR
jgi:hypothetical protein